MLVKMEEIKFKELAAAVKLLNDSGCLKDDGKVVTVGQTKDKIVADFVKAVQSVSDDAEGNWKGPEAVADYYNKIVQPEPEPEPKAKAKAAEKAKTSAKEPDKKPAAKESDKKATKEPDKKATKESGKKEGAKKAAGGARSETDVKGRKLFKEGTNAGKIQAAIMAAPAGGATYEQIAKVAKIKSDNADGMIKKTVGDIVKRGLAKKVDGKIVYIP